MRGDTGEDTKIQSDALVAKIIAENRDRAH
jgi:hypothetical protein